MKKLTAMMCAAALTICASMNVMAAPSISQLIPEAPKVESELPEGTTVVMQNANPEAYTNETVADVVTKFNDEKTVVTVAEALEALNVDLTQEIKTTTGTVIDAAELEKYEAVMPFVDLALDNGVEITYTLEGELKVTFTVEALKECKAEDLLIMLIDPETGDVYFIEIDKDDFDPETGELTATFPCAGPFTILEKDGEDWKKAVEETEAAK